MKREEAPLTKEEQAFAEENYKVLTDYLHFHSLDRGEFHGWAAIGYIKAVRDYLSRPDLREKYVFSTIAKWDMFAEIGRFLKRELRQKEAVQKCMLYSQVLEDTVQDSIQAQDSYSAIMWRLISALEPEQMEMLQLSADGHTPGSVGRVCHKKAADVRARLEETRGKVIDLFPDLAERWIA